MVRPVVIMGGSVRASAFSCRRAGFRPVAIDRFGDRDLALIAPQPEAVSSDWPDGLRTALSKHSGLPVCYVGGLENQPDLIEKIEQRHPLWGNSAAVLRQVRNPLLLAEVLRNSGIAVPQIQEKPANLPQDGSWLEKPRASGGGLGIRAWDQNAAHQPATEPVVYQERIAGQSLGASFLAHPESGCLLLGVCQSWLGAPWGHFVYRGSLGPIPLSVAQARELKRIGTILMQQFGLRGLFGVDLIQDRDERIHVIEVNPRMTASMEVLERATLRKFFQQHVSAFGTRSPKPSSPRRGRGQIPPLVGKAVIYSQAPCQMPAVNPPRFQKALERTRNPHNDRWPSLADLPWPGTRFNTGEPVFTVFAQALDLEELKRRLEGAIQHWTRTLNEPTWTLRGSGSEDDG